jgi:hypothetical protein
MLFASTQCSSSLLVHDPILDLINLTNCKSYLELGVITTDSLKEIKTYVDICVGVDIEKKENTDNVIFYNTTTDEFFRNNIQKFDIIFIDADHKFEQVKIDFENSLKILNEFGIIILHDTDPIDQRLISDDYCSDSYKIIDYIYMEHLELNVITFPIHETGLSFVMRKSDRRIKKI